MHIPLYKDHEFLHRKYVVEGRSIAQVASQILSSKDAVRGGLKAAGIADREPHKPHGRPFQPRYGTRTVTGAERLHMAAQRVIRTIRDMRDQGMTLRQIAQFLSQIGVPTKCRGKAWHPQMVSRILLAGEVKAYDLGKSTNNDSGSHEQIISIGASSGPR